MTLRGKTVIETIIESGIIHIILLAVLVVCAILVAVFKDLLVCTLILGVFSGTLCLEFYFLQAPDVALAEASVGAVLTTALYIITIRATKRFQ